MFFRFCFLCLFLLVGILAVLNFSGFCWEKMRWLSDEEKIRRALSAVYLSPNINYMNDYGRAQGWKSGLGYQKKFNSYYDPEIWRRNSDGSGTRIGSYDVDELLKQNLNCCRVMGTKGRPIINPSLSLKLAGNYADVIEVKYTARFLDKNGNLVKLKDYTEYPVVGNCGRVFTRLD